MVTTASRRVEQKINRRNTQNVISAHPVRIELMRRVTELNNRGGLDTVADQVLPMQTFTIAHQPPRRRKKENNPPNDTFGEIPYAKDMLVGRWDADIQQGDEFDWDGFHYEVGYVFQDRDYQTLAAIFTKDQVIAEA